MLLVFLACWQPDPYAPPPPAQVEQSDVMGGTAPDILPPEVATPAEDGEVRPRSALTVGQPLTLVSDYGAPLQVLGDGVAVTVLMEGSDRVKVRCDGCRPVQEGWLQRRAVSP